MTRQAFLTVLAIISCVAAHASFIWAVLRYFRREGRMSREMRFLSLTGVVCQAGHLLGLVTRPASEYRLACGVVVYLTAVALFWSALATNWRSRLRLAFTDGEVQGLQQSGPYRYVRHPIYASYLLAWGAGAMAINSMSAVAPLLIMGVQYWAAVRREEDEFLASDFETEYRRYRQKAGALTPRLRKRFRR